MAELDDVHHDTHCINSSGLDVEKRVNRGIVSKIGVITIECTDGELVDIDKAVATKMSVAIRKKLDTLKPNSIIQLDNITGRALLKVMEYCHMHTTSEEIKLRAQEMKQWDDRFVRLDPGTLCELASAAYHLEIKPLVDLTCQAIAQLLKGKSPAEIRRTFNILYDFNPEDDAPPPTMRDKLRNKLCSPKRREKIKQLPSTTQPKEDTRSLDELLSFINDNNSSTANSNKTKRSSKAAKRARQRERKKQKKNQQRLRNSQEKPKEIEKIVNTKNSTHEDKKLLTDKKIKGEGNSGENNSLDHNDSKQPLKKQEANIKCEGFNLASLSHMTVSDIKNQVANGKLDLFALSPDDDIWAQLADDDEMDPELKAEQDREVEEFRKRLEAVNKECSSRQKIALSSPLTAALVNRAKKLLDSTPEQYSSGIF